MRLTQYTRVLWDFNGTLIDDVALAVRAANALLARRSLPEIPSYDAYREVFRFPVCEYYEKLGLAREGEAFVRDANEWMEEYRAGEAEIPLRAGILPVLDAVRTAGVPQGVLSATEQGMLEEQVGAMGIRAYFDRLFGREDIFAVDKSDIARRYAADHPGERVLMIGDTLHDAETARAGGFDCVLMEGGHQSRARLASAACPLVETPRDLLAWLTAP